MSKTIGAGLALAVMLFAPAAAQAQVKAGVLSCDVSGGFGWVIGSVKSVNCIFTPDNGERPEAYVGAIRKFGLDVGVTGRQLMVSLVTPLHHGQLAGRKGMSASPRISPLLSR